MLYYISDDHFFYQYIIAFLLLFEILFKSDKMHSKYKIMAYIFWIQQNVLSTII